MISNITAQHLYLVGLVAAQTQEKWVNRSMSWGTGRSESLLVKDLSVENCDEVKLSAWFNADVWNVSAEICDIPYCSICCIECISINFTNS